MKKAVYASAMALLSLSLVSVPALRAQAANAGSSGQISLPPAEYEAYQTATTETNPAAKAQALESFLKTYPQSPVTKEVLDQLIEAYQQAGNPDQELSAASRLLQLDPTDLKAILVSVYIKMGECTKSINPTTGVSSDQQTCDDEAVLAQKGLTVPKPAGVTDADWKNLTAAAYPIFHSAIAVADAAKKDYKDAISEYRAALMLYPPEQTQSGQGLIDTLYLAEAYAKVESKPQPSNELPAIWFFARAWDFVPPAYKAHIEPDLEYWYKLYHGGTDGLDAVKQQAQTTVFPPSSFTIAPAPTPSDVACKVVAETPDLTKLALEDKEFILANGTPACAQKLWSVLQGQITPVPGVVTGVTSSGVTVHVTLAARIVRDFDITLKTPMAAKDIRAVPPDTTSQENFIQANAAPSDDLDRLSRLLKAETARIRKVEMEPNATQVQLAVSRDAKDSNSPDFLVNMKAPLKGKDVPTPGFEYKFLPTPELDGTYSSYTPVPATATRLATAQIVLTDGFVQQEPPKRTAPVRRTVRRSGY